MTRPEPPHEPDVHRAARCGEIAALERLLAAGCDLNARCDLEVDNGPHLRSLTPLMVAARSLDGSTAETLQWLLDHGADLHARSEGDDTAAWYAAGKGGRWDFHEWRVSPEHVDRLRLLLDAGLDRNETNFIGRSLLTEACSAGDPARVRLLLERGVPAQPAFDPEEAKRQHELSVANWRAYLATRSLPPEALEAQLESHREMTPVATALEALMSPLHCAARSGSAECVALLLDAGVDVNIAADEAVTPLLVAGSEAVVRTLCAAGANLRHVDARGRDALEQILDGDCCGGACGPQRFQIARALIAAGLSIEWRDLSGHTRLYSAAFGCQSDVVKFLLASGADPHADQGGSGTPLHAICWQGDSSDDAHNAEITSIVETLIEAGIDVNARSPSGDTPMHEAADGDWGNAPAITALLKHGAEVDARDAQGRSALWFAASSGAQDCIRVLLDAGADPTLADDDDGSAPIDMARSHLQSWEQITSEPLQQIPVIWREPAEVEASHRDALENARACVALLQSRIPNKPSRRWFGWSFHKR